MKGLAFSLMLALLFLGCNYEKESMPQAKADDTSYIIMLKSVDADSVAERAKVWWHEFKELDKIEPPDFLFLLLILGVGGWLADRLYVKVPNKGAVKKAVAHLRNFGASLATSASGLCLTWMFFGLSIAILVAIGSLLGCSGLFFWLGIFTDSDSDDDGTDDDEPDRETGGGGGFGGRSLTT